MNHCHHPLKRFKILGENSGILKHENFHLSQSYLDIKWAEGSRTQVACELR